MKKSVLITSHLLFWIFTTLSLPYLFFIVTIMAVHLQHPGGKGIVHIDETAFLPRLIIILIGACIFYASYFSFHFFLKRPIRFTWIIACYILYTLIVSLPADWISQQSLSITGPILYFNVSGFLFRTCVEWLKDRRIKVELEKDKLASQLELLKSKIDPHFLFNNLNNIDVFIQEDPQKASEYLKKLSDILRFMLYEAGTEKIPLAMEIEYIRKYVDLQKIRTSNSNFVKLEINGDLINKRIYPMILIHLIENAFKYATNKKIEFAVEIKFDVSGRYLSFFCKNHVYSTNEANKEKNGLGIHLLKQKLDLLYKKNYSLITKEENNWYFAILEIQLDED